MLPVFMFRVPGMLMCEFCLLLSNRQPWRNCCVVLGTILCNWYAFDKDVFDTFTFVSLLAFLASTSINAKCIALL